MGQLDKAIHDTIQIDRIVHSDFLDMFAAAMPYFIQRREAARHISGNSAAIEVAMRHFQEMNKAISEIFCLTEYSPVK